MESAVNSTKYSWVYKKEEDGNKNGLLVTLVLVVHLRTEKKDTIVWTQGKSSRLYMKKKTKS